MSSASDAELLAALRLVEGGESFVETSVEPASVVVEPEVDDVFEASQVDDVEDVDPEPSDPRAIWEYCTVLGGAGSKEAAERLNALGAEGWELVGVEPPQPGGQTVFYMKRAVSG